MGFPRIRLAGRRGFVARSVAGGTARGFVVVGGVSPMTLVPAPEHADQWHYAGRHRAVADDVVFGAAYGDQGQPLGAGAPEFDS